MEGSLAGRLLAQLGSDLDCRENERRKLARKNCMHAPSIYLWCNAQPCRHPLFVSSDEDDRWEHLDKRGYVLIDLRKSLPQTFLLMKDFSPTSATPDLIQLSLSCQDALGKKVHQYESGSNAVHFIAFP